MATKTKSVLEGDTNKFHINRVDISSPTICKGVAVYCPKCKEVLAHGMMNNPSVELNGEKYYSKNPLRIHAICQTKLVHIQIGSPEYKESTRHDKKAEGEWSQLYQPNQTTSQDASKI